MTQRRCGCASMRGAHGVVAEHDELGLLERAGVGRARTVVEQRPSSPKSAPSSSTATSDSRPSGDRVRIATRPADDPEQLGRGIALAEQHLVAARRCAWWPPSAGSRAVGRQRPEQLGRLEDPSVRHGAAKRSHAGTRMWVTRRELSGKDPPVPLVSLALRRFPGPFFAVSGTASVCARSIMTFDVGDKVVYPHHGAATIERREKKEAFGEKRDYLVLRLAYGDLTLMVPADNAEEIGLREVINDEEVEEVFAVLRKKEARMPTNWSRRFKNHVEKLKSGDIYQVAEVVRNLSIREADKGLSAGEKRMLARARQILVSELTFALNVDEEAAEARLDEVLKSEDKPAPAKKPRPRRPPPRSSAT